LPAGYTAVLSTHALLHGDHAEVAQAVAGIATLLKADGLLCATFGSRNDPRCAAAMLVREGGWAEPDGAEAGVVHAYFDAVEIRRLLDGFALESLIEKETGAVVGRWAHAGAQPRMHWFVVARRRPTVSSGRPPDRSRATTRRFRRAH